MTRRIAGTFITLLMVAPVLAEVRLAKSPGNDPSSQTEQPPKGGVAGGLCTTLDINQSADPTTVLGPGFSVACYNSGNRCTPANDFARSFDLSVAPTANQAHFVRCVQYGVDDVLDTTGSGSPVTVSLYIDPNGGAPNIADLIPLVGGSITDLVPDGTVAALRFVDFTANNVLVLANATLVVAVESPDLCASAGFGNRYFNGANNSGQTAPSYFRAPDCGFADFTDLAAIGFPDQHMVLTVGLEPVVTGCLTDADCPPAPGECVESYCDLGNDEVSCDSPFTCDVGVLTPCGTPPPGGQCTCFKRPDGTGSCTDFASDCGAECPNGDSDCPAGESCIVETCCGGAYCIANCPTATDNVCLTRRVVGCCVSDSDCPPDPRKCYDSFCKHGNPSDPLDNQCETAFAPECRVGVSKKGSILYYSKIELKWSVAGTPAVATPIQDTFLTIVNDYPDDVDVQWYFINGDAATAAVFSGAPPVLVERAHKGCNQVDCTTRLTEDETTYMSALSGTPLGCQPFTILDRGPLPGRPDPENPGQRILRGYAIAFAVDRDGRAINWNHLSGHVDIVNYADRSAWEYNTYAFQCVADVPQGAACVVPGPPLGNLQMDGNEYELAFDKLLFDFYAVGSFAFSLAPTVTVQLDTDLTLYPVSVDLRTTDTNSDGPVLTQAKFDIWNENEDAQSGVTRCINCWDQTLLSNYAESNSFLIVNLLTNKGKARVSGIQSDDCDAPGACCDLSDDPDCTEVDFDRGTVDRDCSEDAALLGVSDKILFFSGPGVPLGSRTDAGMTLVGQGHKEAVIKRDLIEGPDSLTSGDEAPAKPIRKPDRSRRP